MSNVSENKNKQEKQKQKNPPTNFQKVLLISENKINDINIKKKKERKS